MKLFLNKFSFVLFIILICFSCKRSVSIRSDEAHKSYRTNDKDDYFAKEKDVNTGVGNLSLISWNIQHLGQTKNDTSIGFIVNVLKNFDIVAIQEVVAKHPAGAQKVAQIADELNRMGSKWDYRISNPTKSPSSNMSERYAFLWKTSKVSLAHRAYLDSQAQDLFYREPYIAAFKRKDDIEPFYVINYHSRKHNDNPQDEIIHLLNYPNRIDSNRLIIAGDFNLSEQHLVWKSFYKRGFKSAIQNQRTTLKWKCKNGDYLSHAIDNMYFMSGINMINSAALDLVQNCDNLLNIREISDHLPVFMEFNFN